MMDLRTTTDELLALIGQLTVENRILRGKLAELSQEQATPTPIPSQRSDEPVAAFEARAGRRAG